MTKTQECYQCEGPGQPRRDELIDMLLEIPSHHKIVAITIAGQSGRVFFETRHEGMNQEFKFDTPPERLPS